jgi:mono/diheme cytochrome c family protein
MSKLNAGWKGWLAAAAVAVLLAACGTNSRPTVSGLAQANGPVVGQVSVIDSSAVPVRRTAATGLDGSFSVDTSGMTPPLLVKVEGRERSGPARLFSATGDGRRADANPITTAAFSAAAGTSDDDDDDDAFEHQGGDENHDTAGRVVRLLDQLRTVLAPLFQRYGITDPATDGAAVRLLLEDVRFERDDGVLTVTNRATGAVIFTGPLDDLASGTFDPDAMPPGPGTPPPTGEGALLYEVNCAACHGPLATSEVRGESAGDIREAIQENEGGMGSLSGLTLTQLQAIAAALSGTAGGGTPPPPGDGALLYEVNCAACHGPLATSEVRGESAGDIQAAIAENEGGMGSLSGLTLTQLQAIAAALNGTSGGGTPGACTFTYSAWGTCTGGMQTRTVLSATPAGCTGTPVLSQSCTGTIDGAALYATYCAGCHGNSKKGSSATAIQNAINADVGGMGSAPLRALTPEQVAAIAAAP